MNEKNKTSKNFNIFKVLRNKLRSKPKSELESEFESFVLLVEF
jgi:hypothetical protein